VVAVAGHIGTPDVAAEVTSIVRVDNPSVDVRLARVRANPDDPSGLSAVLNNAADGRPADQPAAIVVPLLALPYPAVTDAIQRLPGSGCAPGDAASEAVMAARLSACPPAVAVAAVPRPVTAIVSRQGTS